MAEENSEPPPQEKGDTWSLVGKVATATTALVGIVWLFQAIFRDSADVIAQCEAFGPRLSAGPLVQRDLDAALKERMEALNSAAKRLPMWLGQKGDAEVKQALDYMLGSAAIGIDRPGEWARTGYVYCDVQNKGSRIAKEVTINVPAAEGALFLFQDGVLSEAVRGEVKLGDLRPVTHRDFEFFSSRLYGSDPPATYLSYAEGTGNVVYPVTAYGWPGKVARFLKNDFVFFVGLFIGFGAMIGGMVGLVFSLSRSAAPASTPVEPNPPASGKSRKIARRNRR